jgi:hypothetical protein
MERLIKIAGDLLDFCETQSWRACVIGGRIKAPSISCTCAASTPRSKCFYCSYNSPAETLSPGNSGVVSTPDSAISATDSAPPAAKQWIVTIRGSGSINCEAQTASCVKYPGEIGWGQAPCKGLPRRADTEARSQAGPGNPQSSIAGVWCRPASPPEYTGPPKQTKGESSHGGHGDHGVAEKGLHCRCHPLLFRRVLSMCHRSPR